MLDVVWLELYNCSLLSATFLVHSVLTIRLYMYCGEQYSIGVTGRLTGEIIAAGVASRSPAEFRFIICRTLRLALEQGAKTEAITQIQKRGTVCGTAKV
jgi:hypothetical protein